MATIVSSVLHPDAGYPLPDARRLHPDDTPAQLAQLLQRIQRKASQRAFPSSLPPEEFLDQAHDELLAAWEHYNPATGIPFYQFAWTYVRYAFLKTPRRYHRWHIPGWDELPHAQRLARIVQPRARLVHAPPQHPTRHHERTASRSTSQALTKLRELVQGFGKDEAHAGAGIAFRLPDKNKEHERDHDRGLSW